MSAQSDRLRRQLEQALADTRVELANRMLTKLRERTPVRTGYTRSRWRLSEEGVTNDEGDAVLRLNDGHSKQRAAGFIEQAIDETVVEVQAVIQRGRR